jgi:membrane-associated PAP2 superfamily phosphatase
MSMKIAKLPLSPALKLVVYPLLAWCAAVYGWTLIGGDLLLGDWLFVQEGSSWIFKEHALVNRLHDWTHHLTLLAGLGVAALMLLSLQLEPFMGYQRELAYVCAAVLGATLSVALLKKASAVACPWSLAQYGGSLPLLGVWDGFMGSHGARALFSGWACKRRLRLVMLVFCSAR